MQLLLESVIATQRNSYFSWLLALKKTLKMRGHRAKTVSRARLRKMKCTENPAVDLEPPAALEDSPLLAGCPHKNVMNE